MIKNGEPYLIEYNIRMGDPECQVIIPRLKTDIITIVESVINNNLKNLKIQWHKEKSMTIVLCSKGYPLSYKKNIEIKNFEKLSTDEKTFIYHAGTKLNETKLFSNGGRVLNFTSMGNNFKTIRKKIIKLIKKLNWKNGFLEKILDGK